MKHICNLSLNVLIYLADILPLCQDNGEKLINLGSQRSSNDGRDSNEPCLIKSDFPKHPFMISQLQSIQFVSLCFHEI